MKVINPFSKLPIGKINLLEIPDLIKQVERAQVAKIKLAELSAMQRFTILSQIAGAISERKMSFAQTIVAESAKPLKYALGEVDRAIQTFVFAAEETKRWPHELFDLAGSKNGEGLIGEYRYFPAGIVFGIAPFNFPLNLAVHKIAPAIATGCPILLKPSSKTPLTMELLKSVIEETNLPDGAFQLVHCSRQNGDFLITHPNIDVLSFTGSPEIGWQMKKEAGKKKVILELGGNAAAIVCADADLSTAIPALVSGAFAYAGQVCIHTQRVYVHQSCFEAFMKAFLLQTGQMVIGAPEEPQTDFSVMIDESNAKRIALWVQEALEAGAKLVYGGGRKDNLFEPTVLTNVPKGCRILEEEAFGPVVIIESFEDLDEAIAKVNDSKWGLQAAIFTDRISDLNKAYKALHVGGVVHNLATTFRVDDMPYGGIKDSGFGREGVRYAMRDYLEGKLLVRKA